MPSLPLKIFVAAVVAVFALATSANAENAEKVRKNKKVATTSNTIQADPYHRGTNLVPAGPLYFGGVYLGDDPDPNIRFQADARHQWPICGDPDSEPRKVIDENPDDV
jgi:hypothetical protein